MVGDLALVRCGPQPQPLSVAHAPPLTASDNDRIRPLLDATDRLRNLMVMKEGIQLPTIVVIGDQYSGKSSVLESLAGIKLPQGQGICTRVPVIMRLQDSPDADRSELYLDFNGRVVPTDEWHLSEAINTATHEIAGHGKGIASSPLNLVIKNDGIPDLTIIDLPEITREPVHGQPENIYEQISDMIMENIRPEESIILNVLSATVDFSTCESMRMSQMVDKTGERTLAVVTEADKAPEGLLEKLMADGFNIGLGYVCVRNRAGDETYQEARLEEAKLFAAHPLLCRIDKSTVGVPVLVQKLKQIQANIMAKYLPEIVKNINDKLKANVAELMGMPKNLSSVEEAMMAFVQIMGLAKESLKKILLSGEFDEYPHEMYMHCTIRLVEMLNQYADELQNYTENDLRTNFLLEEMEVLEEAKGMGLPDFLPRSAFLTLLRRKLNGLLSKQPSFGVRVWDYIEGVVIRVLMRHTQNYPQLQSSMRRAASNLINKMKAKTMSKMMKIVEMEKLTDYTSNPEYPLQWNKLMTQQGRFMDAVNRYSYYENKIALEGIGEIYLGNLMERKHLVREAFDLKMRMIAYWKIVLWRFVDSMALHLRLIVHNLVNKEMEKEVGSEVIGPNGSGRINRMMGERPEVVAKREKLNGSIKLLRESAEVVAKIMDRIATNGDCNN
ncbi:hypothetical protein BT93_B1022 [Corymbia citriodora subsp. variegata]|nr:hypothetical protein BT93_B1022 [Corymbia citriodora subsp. variegata]